ncbi:MAG: EAL domain-containing protein [Thiotrichaceae bacterium]|nr:EAL domain-containing protein [Thiotrichaceae bacterium]
MRLQSKVFIITAIIFSLHFVVDTYMGHRQIREDVIANIKENARTVRGMLMAYRSVYQKIFIERDVPINDTTIKFLPAHAISRISRGFTQWVDNGLSFNTVSDRPRNPMNQADKIELDAMQFFRQNKEAGERFVPYRTESGENFYHFSQPIIIKPRCMKCHGKKEMTHKSIQQRYDTAYNYQIGDLRGLISIKLPAKIIEQRTRMLIHQNLLIHSLGLFFSFILIALLLNRTVLTRIRELQQGSEKLTAGNYETQIDLSGNDELTQMGHTFNHMAQTIAHREQELIRQQSLYYALSQTNKSIAKLNSTEKLLKEICRIAISQNNIIFAWFGMVNSEQSALIQYASTGQPCGYMKNINLSLQADSPNRNCPIINAFHTRKASISNHYLSDPDTVFSHNEAQKAGIQAIASFPLRNNDHIIGVFSVYSDQENYFSDDIVNLLQEMTSDVEYAIKNYNLKEQHLKAQKQLEQSSKELTELNDLMSMLLESTGEGIFGVDINGNCTFVNHAAQNMLGYSLAELKGRSMHQLTHHSHSDHSNFPEENCPIYSAFHSGESCQVDNEVFWRKDGTSFPVQYSAYPIRENNQAITGSVAIFRDTTESRAITQKMNYLASHDSLTSLLNRYSFEQRLSQALETSQFENIQHVVCYIDLDQFKVVNDTCGHLAGDEMLKLIAHLLKGIVRKNDVLARLGGDEFGLLLENCSIEQAEQMTQKICLSVKDFRFVWNDKIFNTGCSIGIAAITEETQSVQNIMSTVDAACYIAKDQGRNQVHISSGNDTETVRHQGEMQWVSKIKKALEDNRFLLYRQTIFPADDLHQENNHFEILLRMQDSQGNIIPPGAFLPAAERYNLISELDRWVIRSTFKWLAANNQNKEDFYFCSINLSGQSIGDKKLYQFIMAQQHIYSINPRTICFEVTESAAVTHLKQAVLFIKQLRKHGFLFALDDFGTGMSSFAYLKNLPVDYLKIDGSFVKDIIDDPIDHAMVKSINDIGHIMGLKTIAEYVENEEIQNELIHMGVDYLQGYGLAKPEPCDK